MQLRRGWVVEQGARLLVVGRRRGRHRVCGGLVSLNVPFRRLGASLAKSSSRSASSRSFVSENC